MPMTRAEYSDNWEWLSKQVRKRNYGRCELCFAPNGVPVYRPKSKRVGEWEYPWLDLSGSMSEPSDSLRETKIILTVHHIDGNKKNNSEQNLISLCQRCHLRLDIEKHMRNRAMSRKKEKEGVE
jgi:hypothetical protein